MAPATLYPEADPSVVAVAEVVIAVAQTAARVLHAVARAVRHVLDVFGRR